MDTPDLNVAFIELEDPTGPYGNKSLGEPPAIPVAPAIRNAILNATGVQMDVTPMTAQRLIEKFKEKGIQIEILREEETWALIYVYRVKKLEEDLKKNEVSKFLRENGYKETCVNYAISLLKKRLMDLKAFPHEIGVFLGYPIEDVIGFINNKGCNFKCCGYWKVYGDKEKAIKEFARYDKCRMIYTKLWNQGRSILKLTVAA